MKHFLARFLGETSWQDLCERFLQTGSLYKISKYERFVDIPKGKKNNSIYLGIIFKFQKRQILVPNSKPKFDPKNEAIFGFA